MHDFASIVAAVRNSEAFKAELKYIRRGGYDVQDEPRLFKFLEHGLVRVVFATTETEITDGTVIALTCLYDLNNEYNIYGHTICAGPGVNTLLRAFDSRMPQALPQPAPIGEREIRRFVAWKEASWVQFLNDDLDLGTERASQVWLARFWKAMDRMFGGGTLVNYDPEAVLALHGRSAVQELQGS